MSRIGKVPIKLPKGVQATLGPGPSVTVKGPKGEQTIKDFKRVAVSQKDGALLIERAGDEREDRANHGLVHRLISAAVAGVNTGYTKELELVGVGYKAELKGKALVINCGYTHEIKHEAPAGVSIVATSPTKITITGYDKQAVGQQAAKIRSYAPPEPYKGKGIRYAGENVRRKVGKTGAK